MSQAKVDKYKEEKKNREKNIKKAKLKKALTVLLWAAITGIIIGFPMGKIMYNNYYEKKMNSATISATIYDSWLKEYWDVNHGDKFNQESASSSDLSDEEIQELVGEISSNTDAIVVTPENLDQDALQDAIEAASDTDAQ